MRAVLQLLGGVRYWVRVVDEAAHDFVTLRAGVQASAVAVCGSARPKRRPRTNGTAHVSRVLAYPWHFLASNQRHRSRTSSATVKRPPRLLRPPIPPRLLHLACPALEHHPLPGPTLLRCYHLHFPARNRTYPRVHLLRCYDAARQPWTARRPPNVFLAAALSNYRNSHRTKPHHESENESADGSRSLSSFARPTR